MRLGAGCRLCNLSFLDQKSESSLCQHQKITEKVLLIFTQEQIPRILKFTAEILAHKDRITCQIFIFNDSALPREMFWQIMSPALEIQISTYWSIKKPQKNTCIPKTLSTRDKFLVRIEDNLPQRCNFQNDRSGNISVIFRVYLVFKKRDLNNYLMCKKDTFSV